MATPRIEIFLNRNNDFCVAKVIKNNDESQLIFNIPFGELNMLDSKDAALRIGGSIFGIFKLWYKNLFENFKMPAAVDVETEVADDGYTSAIILINQAISSRSAIYNPSIEYLLERAAIKNKSASEYFQDVWPLLRDRLGKS